MIPALKRLNNKLAIRMQVYKKILVKTHAFSKLFKSYRAKY